MKLWNENPELFGNSKGDRFPLLIKIIDAKDDLSIQVHPNDKYANIYENGSLGKTECWYILDAPEGSTLVIGHNAKSNDELKSMIKNENWKEFLREVPVNKGDFIQIDPGTVHAIKGGIEILETQQNSDITYRVYDYNRLQDGKPRQLHIDKSLDVITVPAKSKEDSIIKVNNSLINQMNLLIECDYYKVWKINIDEQINISQKYPFLIMSVTEGDGYLNEHPIKKGDHFIIPNNYGTVNIKGKLEIIASTIADAC